MEVTSRDHLIIASRTVRLHAGVQQDTGHNEQLIALHKFLMIMVIESLANAEIGFLDSHFLLYGSFFGIFIG